MRKKSCNLSLSSATSTRPHLNDQVSLGIPSHAGELGSELLELGPAVRINHPA